MARQRLPNRESQVQYIAERKLFSRKELSAYSDAYVKRIYSYAAGSESRGEAFDRDRARGHPPKVQQHAPTPDVPAVWGRNAQGKRVVVEDFKPGTRENWSVGSQAHPVSIVDIERVMKQAPVGKFGNYWIAIDGIPKEYPGKNWEPGERITRSYVYDAVDLRNQLASGKFRNVYELAAHLSGVEWTEVYGISMGEAYT